MASQKTIPVRLGRRSYDVRVGPGLINDVGQAARAVRNASTAVVISDSKVAELYGPQVVDSLDKARLSPTLIDFPAGEQHKTLLTYGRLFDELFAVTPAIDRNCLIVALGGGVAGDLAGFIAATALRGLKWLQCPTTLLADVDASVGGKTAVDHPAGKNLIGAFHQPRGVLIDVEALKTLPAEELRNGLAECVKHAFIRDESLLDFIEENVEAILECRPEAMTELIARNVQIKAAVVAADERESAQRAHLNFGHTVGHAIEALVGFGKISHGRAVALGMIVACRMAGRRNLVDSSVEKRLVDILQRLGLPTSLQAGLPTSLQAGVPAGSERLDAEAIWRIMQHDKKARGGKVRMVLPIRMGMVSVFDDIEPEEVRQAIESLT